MICAKALDALASLHGWEGQDADARKAYTQAHLSEFEGDTETCIAIDPDQYPDSWKNKDGTCKYRRPYFRLVRNLYGHPLAGLYWEKHCHKKLLKCGFGPKILRQGLLLAIDFHDLMPGLGDPREYP